jgi:hypothetical protein
MRQLSRVAVQLADLAGRLQGEAFDGLDEMCYSEGFYAYEVDRVEKLRNRTPLNLTQGRPASRAWGMDEILVFLNNLGDDWWCSRRGRAENIRFQPTFT